MTGSRRLVAREPKRPGLTARAHGPQQPTFLERLVNLVPLPYTATCLLLGMVLGPFGLLLARYLQTGQLTVAQLPFFQQGLPVEPWRLLAPLLASTLQNAYAFWMIRRVRQVVVAAEPGVAPLLPGGVQGYRQAFAGLGAIGPAAAVAVALMLVFGEFIINGFPRSAGPLETAYAAGSTALVYAGYGSAVWIYARSLWAVYRFGQLPLRLKAYAEDAMLGLQPIGSLTLSISWTYFGLVGFLVLILAVSPLSPIFAVMLVLLTVLGAVLFFLPLDGIHRQMVRVKGEAQVALHRRLVQLGDPGPHSPHDSAAASDAAVRQAVMAIKEALVLESASRRVNDMPTWPFDTQMLRRLGTIVLTILVAIITQFLLSRLSRL